MHSSRLALLIVGCTLVFLALLPSTTCSPGHYVHDYYREGTYNGRGRNEQGRSPRHLNARNSAHSLWSADSVLAAVLLVAAALRQQFV